MNSKHNARPRSIWWIVILFLGVLLLAQCKSSHEYTPSVVGVPTPAVSDLVIMSGSRGELLPGEEVKICVSVTVGDTNTPPVYRWNVKGGEIVDGQGTAKITYKAPDTPGTCGVSLKVEYGDWDTERSKSIVVIPPTPTPTPTPTDTPTSTNTPPPTNTPTATPTDTPTPTPTFTPTPIPPTSTPTVTPTPTLLPPPTPLAPANGECFVGAPVTFRWQLDYRPLEQNEIFSLRVYREGETEPCHHDKTQGLEYSRYLSYCSTGKHYWRVALVRQLCEDCPEEEKWQPLSEPSEERWIYYTPPGEEVWVPPPPLGEEEEEEGGGTGGSPRPP